MMPNYSLTIFLLQPAALSAVYRRWKQTKIDMEVGLKIYDMNDLLKFIPDAYFQNRDKTLAKGATIMEGTYTVTWETVLFRLSTCVVK